jgi:hypothetical protein
MIAKVSGPGHTIETYEISDQEMSAGSTLGSPKATMWIKATGAIEKLWSIEAGINVFETLVVHHWDERSGIPLTPLPGQFVIHPDHQEHIFELSNGITVHEDLLVLSGEPQGPDMHQVDPAAAYYHVQLTNDSEEEQCVASYAGIQLKGGFIGTTHVEYSARQNAFVVTNSSAPGLVRYAACSVRPKGYEVTLDAAKPNAATFPGKLSGNTMETPGDAIGLFHLSHTLAPGKSAQWYIVLTFSLDGAAAAQEVMDSLPDYAGALQRTRSYYDAVLDRAVVMTPDPQVNRGVLWAKANMLRTELLSQQGWCFVNDPTRSNNSVCRDTAWFAFGSDYVTPHFSKESLRWYATHLEPSGMAVEYFDIRTGATEDYGLNINDNTPLLILAIWHHYHVTGDRAFLEELYPQAKRMADYIVSQRNDQGLVWCTADGTYERGIVGWRNVIPDYRLSGATTEINSECYAALNAIATMARELGLETDDRHYLGCAGALRDAINEHLLDKERNVYYLNIDLDGTKRTDVTSDMMFPVMFGVADHETAANIISRMSVPEFWSEPGIHTVPRTAIHYGPTHGFGLLGGIWVGVTFWYAFAAAQFNPEFMASALSESFRHYSSDPRHNNTVPGQFSEWLHGETLVNQGMMLSPWYPPRYVWAAIEGMAGLDLRSNTPKLDPRPAREWKWLGVRNLSLQGNRIAWFAVRTPDLIVYVNHAFESVDPERQFEDDISGCVHVSGEEVVVIALRRKDAIAVFVGNTKDRTVSTALRMEVAGLDNFKNVQIYNSLRGEWVQRPIPPELGTGLPIQIDRHGFCVLEFSMEA